MPLQFLVFDQRFDLYRDRLAQRFPNVLIHATADRAEAERVAPDVDALFVISGRAWPELVAKASRLRWIQILSTGYDKVLGFPGLRPEIVMTSARGTHGPQMSEMAILMMLALSRKFPRMVRNQAEHVWERWFQGLLLNKTVAIVGVGTIAEELAPRCKAFGMRVIGVSERLTQAAHFDLIVPRARLKEIASDSDYLVLLVPLDDNTRGMIGTDVLDAMKPTAFLINLARGEVVDQAALTDHLARKAIAGAALDVFETEPLAPENPLWDMDGTIVTPHVGGMSDIYIDQVLDVVVQNATAFIGGRMDDMKNIIARTPPAIAQETSR